VSERERERERESLLTFILLSLSTAYWWAHVKYIPNLWRYMVPLFFVYAAEYMINQGFFELLYNPNTHIRSLCISQEAQYRL
jgi:hypothetical protein